MEKEVFADASFLIMATDETDALVQTVETLKDICDDKDIDKYLIVYPKNVSPDTAKTIKMLEEKCPEKVEGKQQIRPGIGGAIKDGMDFATSSHVIFMVSDLAIELDAIPKIIEEAKKHPNAVVKTSRWMEGGGFFRGYSPVRKFFNRIAQSFLRVLFQTKLTDITSPCQVMPTMLCRSWNMKGNGFPMCLEMVIVPLRLGDEIIELPSKCYGREEGKSKNSFFKTASYLFTALRVRFTPKEKLRKKL